VECYACLCWVTSSDLSSRKLCRRNGRLCEHYGKIALKIDKICWHAGCLWTNRRISSCTNIVLHHRNCTSTENTKIVQKLHCTRSQFSGWDYMIAGDGHLLPSEIIVCWALPLLLAKRDETLVHISTTERVPQLFAKTKRFRNSFICYGLPCLQ